MYQMDVDLYGRRKSKDPWKRRPKIQNTDPKTKTQEKLGRPLKT